MDNDDWDFDEGCDEQFAQQSGAGAHSRRGGAFEEPPDLHEAEPELEPPAAALAPELTAEAPVLELAQAAPRTPKAEPTEAPSVETPPAGGVLPLLEETPPEKRPRLVAKTRPTEGWKEAAAAHSAEVKVPRLGSELTALDIPETSLVWWTKKDHSEKYDYVYNKLRRGHVYETWQVVQSRRKKQKVDWPRLWTGLALKEKTEFLSYWTEHAAGDTPAFVRQWAVENLAKDPAELTARKPRQRNRVNCVLLTYQGPLGDIRWRSSLPATTDVDTAVERCRADPYVKKLWQKALDELTAIATTSHSQDEAISLEVCPETLQNGLLRVHFHVCLKASGNLDFKSIDELILLGMRPHASNGDSAKKRRKASDWSAFYYVVTPKIGSVFTHSSQRAFKDFSVNAEWVWNLLQQEKLTLETARAEILRGKKNLRRHYDNLDLLSKELTAQDLREEIARKNVELAAKRCKFMDIPEVTRWVESIKELADRRKFLVLDGPSKMGKTQFACSLVPLGKALEVNCAQASHPPLRAFNMRAHSLILFDEASPQMVADNRRLFQAPNAEVTIGSSPTNSLAYAVYLNSTHLVVASNGWAHELKAMPAGDRDWLVANSVYIEVKKPLWIPKASSSSK